MAYLVEELKGIMIDDEFVSLEIGDTVLIETDELVIKEAVVAEYHVSLYKTTITVEYCDYESIEIDIESIIRIE